MTRQRYLQLALLGWLLLIGAGTARAQFNPSNPPEPYLYYKVTVSSEPANVAYVSGAGSYLSGTRIHLNTSASNPSYAFQYWTLNGEVYSQERGFDVDVPESNASFVAHYAFVPSNPDEPTSMIQRRVYFASQPSGIASFSQTSGARYTVGSQVSVRAYPNQGYVFQGWYDGETLVGTSNPCNYTLPDRNVTLTAHFLYDPLNPADPSNFYSTSCIIEVAPNDATRGTVTISGLTEGRAVFGNTITVTATPTEGYTFSGWSDGTKIVSTDATYSFTAEKAEILTAFFLREPHTLTYLVDGEVFASMVLEAETEITPLAEPIRDGYLFSGWSEIPATMPYGDVTVNGSFALTSMRIEPGTATLAGGEKITLKAYAGTTSTEEVTGIQWSVSNPTVASISSRGIARGLKIGTTTIYASSTNFVDVTATMTVTVTSNYDSPVLPDVPFEFNYNALDYDEETHRIPNNEGAALADYNLQLRENIPTYDEEGYLALTSRCEGYIDRWASGSTESGTYFYRSGQDDMTIIVKVAPKLDTRNASDLIANRGSGYNYMLRVGDSNTFYLHTSEGYSNSATLPLTTEEPQVLVIRAKGSERKIYLENKTTGETAVQDNLSWGGSNNVFRLFRSNSSVEYFQGKFYWAYYSFGYLDDSEVDDVVEYNESYGQVPVAPVLVGDVDGNGIVNVSDAVDLIDYYLKGTTDQLDPAVADLDSNGIINVSDAVEIIEKYLHNN